MYPPATGEADTKASQDGVRGASQARMAEEKTIQTEVREFVAALPRWQRILLCHVFTGSVTDDAATIQNSYDTFLIENKLSNAELDTTEIELPDVLGSAGDSSKFAKLRLRELKDVQNLNAIHGAPKLTFGENLTVIYGDNGTGKSGFARLMNNVFYSRGDKSILPNVFGPKTDAKTTAKFAFQDGDAASYSLEFPKDRSRGEFTNFAVFDSESARVHLNNENVLYVVPTIIQQFSRLADLINAVLEKFDKDIKGRKQANKFGPNFDGPSALKTAVENLSSTTNIEKVRQQATLKPEEDTRLAELETELGKLKSENAEAKKKELGQIRSIVDGLKKQVAGIAALVTNEAVENYKQSIEAHRKNQELAKQAGAEQFQYERFFGIGSQTWKTFIQEAKSFAELQNQHGGSTSSYPKTGDSCILCRQTLTAGSIKLMENYWKFLSGEGEKNLRISDASIKRHITALTVTATMIPAEGTAARKWLTENETTLLQDLESVMSSYLTSIGHLKNALETITGLETTLSPTLDSTRIDAAVKKIDDQVAALDAEKVAQRIATVTTDLTLLKHRKKLGEIVEEVVAFIENEKWIVSATEIKKKTNTTKLTNLNTRLHNEILGKEYRRKFEQECGQLNALYSVNVKQGGDRGKTNKSLYVEKYKPSAVLSEGEQKCIALADFFTETEITGICSGLIFDDPVTSLDHERRELIAKRLAKAAKSMQVVVFTHDLSFLYDLRNAAEAAKVDCACHWVEKIDDRVGVVTHGKSPNLEKDHLGTERSDQKLKESRSTEIDAEKRKEILQEGMSKLRRSYEAFVLIELFSQVMTRFDRRIRPDNLKKVFVARDHIDFICGKHAYLSGFIDAHLESDHANVPLTPDVLEREINTFKEFQTTYKTARTAHYKEHDVKLN